MLILNKKNQNYIVIGIDILCFILIILFVILAIFTPSKIVYDGGFRYAVIIAGSILGYSTFFKKLQNKNDEITIGILFLLTSTLPIFGADFLGGIKSPAIAVIFPIIAIGFILGGLWGAAFEIIVAGYLAISIIIFGTGLIETGIIMGASIITGTLFYFIGKKYRFALQEKIDLENSNLTLSASQNKEEALLAGIADGVYVVDMDRNMTMFNSAAEEMTGWKANEAIGLKCWTVMNLKNETDISVCQKDCPALNVWNTGENVLRDDTCFNRKKGNKKTQISSSYSPIKDKNGKLTGAICVFRDVTTRKEVDRLRNEFVSTASHELRTPITAMEGYMELIENEKICQIDNKAKEYVEKARGTALGMSNLVKNLLTVTKIEEGKIQTDITKFSIHELAEDVVEAMSASAKNRNLELKIVETTGQSVRGEKSVGRSLNVVADKEQVREVMYNLIENGLKFTAEGGVSISINYDKDFATVCIADTGMGIPADGQKHLFEKFYRYDNTATREVGGTGLGLFITRSIVESFGGRIWLESQVNKGTKFFFTIPRSLD